MSREKRNEKRRPWRTDAASSGHDLRKTLHVFVQDYLSLSMVVLHLIPWLSLGRLHLLRVRESADTPVTLY